MMPWIPLKVMISRELNKVPAQLCSDSYTTLHGLCTTVPQVLYNSLCDPTILSYPTIEKLNYNLRYGSAGPFFKFKLKSKLSSTTSTIFGVSSSPKYMLYTSSMGSGQFMTIGLSVRASLVNTQGHTFFKLNKSPRS